MLLLTSAAVIKQCFTSPPTQYRLYGRQFYRSKQPTNSIKVLKEMLQNRKKTTMKHFNQKWKVVKIMNELHAGWRKKRTICFFPRGICLAPVRHMGRSVKQESCAIAKMTARCAAARYISRSWAVAEIWPFKIRRHLEFGRIENSENPTL